MRISNYSILTLVTCSFLSGCRCVPTQQEPHGYSSTYHDALEKYDRTFFGNILNPPFVPVVPVTPPLQSDSTPPMLVPAPEPR